MTSSIFAIILVASLIYIAGVASGDWWREKIDQFVDYLAYEEDEDEDEDEY